MPGANYMGGKRNAARARVKDATGKVQRNHFGKKRFEILRTGLSKGQATTSHAQNVRGGLNPRAEISLAHAHRTQYQHDDDTQTWLPNAYDSSSPIGNARSTPALASGRSHILRVLDAENSVAQRAQADKILQIPDLLGLSMSRHRSVPPSSCDHDDSTSNSGEQHGFDYNEPISPAVSNPSSTPVFYFTAYGERDGTLPSYLSFDGESAIASSSSSNKHRRPEQVQFPCSRHDPAFVPMHLDSSPAPRMVDPDRSECWPDLHRDQWPSETTLCESYKPTRIPFYSSRPSSVLSESPLIRQPSTSRPTGSFVGLTSDSPRPSPFQHSRHSFCSSVSQLSMPTSASHGVSINSPNGYQSSLPPSDSSRFSWSGSTSYQVESDDVPQASFSLSPPRQAVLQDFAITGARFEDSQYSVGTTPEPERNHTTFAHPIIDIPLDDSSEHWQQITLADLFDGALFENADPWNALDEILHLSSLGSRQGEFSDLLALVETCDTSSVGLGHPLFCYPQSSRYPKAAGPAHTTPDSTLEEATSGEMVDRRFNEGSAQIANTDRIPIDRALVEIDAQGDRSSSCEQSDGLPVKASSPGSDPRAIPTPLETPVGLRGDDIGPVRMEVLCQGTSPLHDQNVDTHDAHSHISAHASEDRRGAVVEGRVLLDGPSLFSDFEDFESEED